MTEPSESLPASSAKAECWPPGLGAAEHLGGPAGQLDSAPPPSRGPLQRMAVGGFQHPHMAAAAPSQHPEEAGPGPLPHHHPPQLLIFLKIVLFFGFTAKLSRRYRNIPPPPHVYSLGHYQHPPRVVTLSQIMNLYPSYPKSTVVFFKQSSSFFWWGGRVGAVLCLS